MSNYELGVLETNRRTYWERVNCLRWTWSSWRPIGGNRGDAEIFLGWTWSNWRPIRGNREDAEIFLGWTWSCWRQIGGNREDIGVAGLCTVNKRTAPGMDVESPPLAKIVRGGPEKRNQLEYLLPPYEKSTDTVLAVSFADAIAGWCTNCGWSTFKASFPANCPHYI